MTFPPLSECFFPLSSFISLTEGSEGRKWNLLVAYYKSTSLLTGENRSKSFESYIIILTKIRMSFPLSGQFQKLESRKMHQYITLTLILDLHLGVNYRYEEFFW